MILKRNRPKTEDTSIISVVIIGIVTVLLYFTYNIGKMNGNICQEKDVIINNLKLQIEEYDIRTKTLVRICEERYEQIEKRDKLIEKLFKVIEAPTGSVQDEVSTDGGG